VLASGGDIAMTGTPVSGGLPQWLRNGGAADGDLGPGAVRGPGGIAITILRLAGHANVAAALRYHARKPGRPLQTIMQC
jgi:hypothetical protein